MPAVLMQLQMLLSALSAFMQVTPLAAKPRALEALSFVGRALSAGAAAAEEVEDLADRLRVLRLEVEQMAQRREPLRPEELDAALARVRAASAGFQEAVRGRG